MDHNLAPARPLQVVSTPDVPGQSSGQEFSVFRLLLLRTSKANTQRAYRDNLRGFFADLYGADPKLDPPAGLVRQFLSLTAPEAAMMLGTQRALLSERGRAASTINLRLAAVRALVDLANDNGFCAFDSKGLVKSLKAEAYRDTRGPGLENVKRLLALPDRTVLIGRRDFAMLRLLADNGLRRFEVCGVQVSHFEPGGRRLSILGKRRDTREWVTLHPTTTAAISDYLSAAGHTDGGLFRNCASRPGVAGAALTEDGLDDIIRRYGKRIGLPSLSCHKFRHFAITALLDATGGDMRKVQKFSRHKSLDILRIYDDNRADHQGEMTILLGDLLESA